MKNVLKTILLTLHLQIIMNLIFFLMIQFGIKVFNFHEQALINTFLYSLSLMFVYFLFALVLCFIRPQILNYPFKVWALLILLMSIYSISFVLSQSDFNAWRIYFIAHLPIGYFIRPFLASQFDLSQQFLICISALTPALGITFAYELCAWIKRKRKKSRLS